MTIKITSRGVWLNHESRPCKSQPDRTVRLMRTTPVERLALEHGIEIEALEGGGMNVWAPQGIDESVDPYAGDHYASDFTEALAMVEVYVGLKAQAK